jgi:AmpD protein
MMKVDKQGWLNQAIKRPSPNYDQREADAEISLLVIHNISLPPACYEGNAVERFFLNRLEASEHPYFEKIAELKVSAHLFIRRDGEVIQFVSFADRAWHAGQSCFAGQSACNNYSIGIELEGTDTEPYSEQQYQQLQVVTEALHQAYPAIQAERITGHEHIAPGRKTDPGPSFDWSRYLGSLSFTKSALALPQPQDTLA